MGERIEASWLAVRREADTAAREASLGLVNAVARHIASLPASHAALHVVDVGAGTGANTEWLAPRLDDALLEVDGPRRPQHWHLLDHDRSLLAARQLTLPTGHVRVSDHLGTTADAAQLIDNLEGYTLLTCSALLDLLTPAQIDSLVRAAVSGAEAALFALSVTGVITISPADSDDAHVSALFNAHQRQPQPRASEGREAAAGPDGWSLARDAFEAAGWTAQVSATPWHLGARQAPLVSRLLTERAAAAAQMTDDAAGRAGVEAWLARRARQLDRGDLAVSVDHRDVLALPARSTSVQMSSPSA